MLFDQLGKVGSYIGDKLKDPDVRDRLILGMQGLTMNPNQGLIDMAKQGIKDRRDIGIQTQQANKTLEFLRAKGVDEATLKSLEGNPQMLMAYASELMKKGMSSNKDLEKVSAIRKEYVGQAKPFAQQAQAFTRMNSVYSAGASPANDIALIFQYMKMLDPASTVREGEFATAQNAGNVSTKVSNLYNSVMKGQRLSDEQRKDFFSIAKDIYSSSKQQDENLRSQYGEFISDYGYEPDKYLPNFAFKGQIGAPKDINVPPMLDPNSATMPFSGTPQDKVAQDMIKKLGISVIQ